MAILPDIYIILYKFILQQRMNSPDHASTLQLPLPQSHHPQKSGTLQSVTILLIFLIIVINQIFLISLIAVLIRKIKFVIKTTAKKYYYFVIFYIVSKLSLCIFLQVKIISGIPEEFKEIQSATIETIFDNSLTFADCSIVQLFLISFEHYIALSFSIFGNRRTQKLIRILMQGAQMVTFFTLIIPLLLFNINLISYPTLNIFTMSLNCLSVIVFIAAFFFMNFKMTGLMMQRRSTEIIKKVYALLLALLISRLIMSFVQVWVQINITNGSFEDFISIIEENQNQFVVLGLCFIAYLVIIMLTEGLPLIMSLRQSVATALAELPRSSSRPSSMEQSLITQSNNEIKEQLLNNLDMSQLMQEKQQPSQRTSSQLPQNYHGISRIENPDELEVVEKIMAVREDFLSYKAKWIKTNKFYFVKRMKNISNYIIEQILNEVDFYKKLETKVINPIKVLEKSGEGEIFLIQKYLPQNLLKRLDKAVHDSLKHKVELAIKIAKAIQEFHKATKTGHGVLNTKNIMFDEEDRVILTGFGMESLKKYLSLTTQYSNLTMYTAVQLLGSARQKKITKPNKPADIYSFGVILYQLISGNFKYRNLTLPEIRNKFQKQNTRPKIPQDMNEEIKKLMRKCWQQKPENRPSIEYVITMLETLKSSL